MEGHASWIDSGDEQKGGEDERIMLMMKTHRHWTSVLSFYA